MKFLEKMIYLMFPSLLVASTPWENLWEEKERHQYIKSTQIVLFLISIVYIGHYFFFDKVVGLTPIEHWFKFRFGMASLCLFVAGLYWLDFVSQNRFYKIPGMLALAAVCITQSYVSVWYAPASYLFSCAFTYLAGVLLRTSMLKSLIYTGAILVFQYPRFIEAGISTPMAISSCAVVLSMVAFSRTSFVAEIKYFIANQQNISAQKQIIETNIEFTNQIKAFLPKEISRRLDFLINERRMNVIEATDELLRPRKKIISCLFTDIRGFTQGSKDLDQFVGEGVIPNVKECTRTIENVKGIQRKIGDLIFSYFDSDSIEVNTLNAIVAGFEIVDINQRFNQYTKGHKIQRFVLISTGEAVVGNIGNFESSIEITALGTPVNFLARLDDSTKQMAQKSLLSETDILVDQNTMAEILRISPNLEYREINLKENDIEIRDFEEVLQVFAIPASQENRQKIWTIYEFTESTLAQEAA